MRKMMAVILVAMLVWAGIILGGCAEKQEEQPPFELDVIPVVLHGHAIASQTCSFLVRFRETEKAGTTPVVISAESAGTRVVVNHDAVMAGDVAEVLVIPDSSSVGKTISVTILGTRGGMSDSLKRTIEVIEGEDDRRDDATEMLDLFIPWLATQHPELNISEDTHWEGTMVSPQWLIVSHYLFFSEEWELHLEWHVMIAPHDWVRIDLRHRYDQHKPSYAFEISSREAKSEPVAIKVPEAVWR